MDIKQIIEKLKKQNKKIAFDYMNKKDVTVITLYCEDVDEIIFALERQLIDKDKNKGVL